jgi:hypothetical protein
MGVITTLADRASEAEAGIGEGGEWIAGAAGSGSPPPMEHGVALDGSVSFAVRRSGR